MSVTLVDLFNAKLKEFSDDLCKAFPNVSDFSTLKSAVALAVNLAPSQPYQFFRQHVVSPYASQILAQDENFFLSQELLVEEAGGLDVVQRLRGVWADMTNDDKDSVWKYLKVLILICNKI